MSLSLNVRDGIRSPHSSRPVPSTPRVLTPARHISISASSTLDSRLRQRSITADPNRAPFNSGALRLNLPALAVGVRPQWPARNAFRSVLHSYPAALAISSVSASGMALMVRSTLTRTKASGLDSNMASSNRMILSDMAPGLLSNRGFHVQATENRTKAGPCPFHRNSQPNLRKKTGVIHLSVAVAQFTVAEEPERNLEIIDGFARDAAAGDREADLITAELSRECLDSAR